jgi:16S rRNA U516 pseudouridylate synthase RsuA-like enzyme
VLTNDGLFSNQLTHPRYGVKKHYRVWVKSIPNIDLFLRTTCTVKASMTRVKILRATSAKSNFC